MMPITNPQLHQSNCAPSPASPAGIAPGRLIEHTVRKAFPDGRILEFRYRQQTGATIHGTYETIELIEAPTLDCTCTACDRDDAVACAACNSIVCGRRHAATCMLCGQIYCSHCLQGIVTQATRVIACHTCADDVTASRFTKVMKAVTNLVWGE